MFYFLKKVCATFCPLAKIWRWSTAKIKRAWFFAILNQNKFYEFSHDFIVMAAAFFTEKRLFLPFSLFFLKNKQCKCARFSLKKWWDKIWQKASNQIKFMIQEYMVQIFMMAESSSGLQFHEKPGFFKSFLITPSFNPQSHSSSNWCHGATFCMI